MLHYALKKEKSTDSKKLNNLGVSTVNTMDHHLNIGAPLASVELSGVDGHHLEIIHNKSCHELLSDIGIVPLSETLFLFT